VGSVATAANGGGREGGLGFHEWSIRYIFIQHRRDPSR